MRRTLIVFYGHLNAEDGTLSAIAQRRAAKVAEVFQATPDADVLVCAGHGSHFNQAPAPHWRLLQQQLLALGVPPGRIVAGGDAMNTVEESLRARRVVLEQGYDAVVGVTSDFHAARVAWILGRVLPEFEAQVLAAAEPGLDASFHAREAASTAFLRASWVYPPLWQRGAEFPQALYDQAAGERRRLDMACLATPAVVALATIAAVAADRPAALLAGTAVVIAGVAVQERALRLSTAARMFMRSIEVGFAARGFPAGHDDRLLAGRWGSPLLAGHIVAAGSLLALAADALLALAKALPWH